MPEMIIHRLDERQLAKVYPLVRSAVGVSRARWEDYGRELIAGGGGIVAVEAGGECLHGVAAFRPLGSLRHDLILQVELLVAFELSRQAPVRRALCAALTAVAREQGCRAIQFTLTARSHAERDSPMRASWERLGLEMETVAFVQRLQEPASV